MNYAQKKDVLSEWIWFIEVSIGLGIMLILSFALYKAARIIHKKTQNADKSWKRKIDTIFHLPLQIAIWGFALAHFVDIAATHFNLGFVVLYVRPLKAAFIVACFSWIILRWIKEAFRHMAKKSSKLGVASGTIFALQKLATFVFLVIVLSIIFQIFGINIIPLLAFGGIGVAGIAFAAQDFIANFFGGAMLHFTGTFFVGDEISIPSQGNFEGEVKEIGWYTTVVEDYFKRPVYFPNALFSKAYVINESRRTHRRIKETVSIRYDDISLAEAIVADLKKELAAHPAVDSSQSFSVSISKLGEVGLEIYFYLLLHRVPLIRFLGIKQEIWLLVQSVIYRHGAQFAHPTTLVHLSQFSSGHSK